MVSNGKPTADGEVLLGSEDFSAEEEQFGQSGHGAGVSALLLEHRQHETMVPCTCGLVSATASVIDNLYMLEVAVN